MLFDQSVSPYNISGNKIPGALVQGDSSSNANRIAFNLKLNFIDVSYIVQYSDASLASKISNQILIEKY
ncbi:hypothetical protein SCLARK_0014 [Spiroplasma clarkii]|uniref:hypothetical protein n=1 Tax=Spiroplasma clarkii TaxID=2139 RepID=UPI000B55568E|nr:hypothetical protein [Spiroplasma clarkii]ARU90849.1 hypothetical protein SCLARK_0014 [Spiroplasma clarkii]